MKVAEVLQMFLPESPFYAVLSDLPKPDPTNPTATTTSQSTANPDVTTQTTNGRTLTGKIDWITVFVSTTTIHGPRTGSTTTVTRPGHTVTLQAEPISTDSS